MGRVFCFVFRQLRISYVLPLATACAAIDCGTLLPHICCTYYPGVEADACIRTNALRMLLAVLASPLAVIYLLESHARKLFLLSTLRD